jgi:hypothetical protein
MERAWSTRTHEHVRQACEEGSDMIEKLAKQSGEAAAGPQEPATAAAGAAAAARGTPST